MGVEYLLPEKWIEFLKSQPESGMGYQTVDIHFKERLILKNVDIIGGGRFYFRNDRLDLEDIEKIVVQEKSLERSYTDSKN